MIIFSYVFTSKTKMKTVYLPFLLGVYKEQEALRKRKTYCFWELILRMNFDYLGFDQETSRIIYHRYLKPISDPLYEALLEVICLCSQSMISTISHFKIFQ